MAAYSTQTGLRRKNFESTTVYPARYVTIFNVQFALEYASMAMLAYDLMSLFAKR